MSDPVIIVAPTVGRFTMKGVIAGAHRCYNNVDVSIDTGPTATREDVMKEMAPKVTQYWQDHVVRNLSNMYSYQGCHFIDLDSATGVVGDQAPIAGYPNVGTNINATASPQVCFLVHLNSAAKRHQRQGRLYLSPVPETDVDQNGGITVSAQNLWNGALDSFRQAIDGYSSLSVESAAWRTVHVHKQEPGNPATWVWSSSTIDSVRCDTICATQRRRVRG